MSHWLGKYAKISIIQTFQKRRHQASLPNPYTNIQKQPNFQACKAAIKDKCLASSPENSTGTSGTIQLHRIWFSAFYTGHHKAAKTSCSLRDRETRRIKQPTGQAPPTMAQAHNAQGRQAGQPRAGSLVQTGVQVIRQGHSDVQISVKSGMQVWTR